MTSGSGQNSGAVIIEVVLDDGSTKKYFANLKKDAANASKDASKEASQIDNALSGKSVTDFKDKLGSIVKAYAGIGLAATAAAAVVGAAFKTALAGEAAAATDKIFDRIAGAQGLDTLRFQLEDAGKGFLDVGDILQKTSQSVINLGANAAKLPQLLDLATQSALKFGGTAEDRFQGLVQAVETGNTKILRQQGIIVDAEKVMTDYAQAMGLTASELNQAQKQQALLNAVIEDGSKRIKAAGDDVAPLQSGVTRLQAGFKEFTGNMEESIGTAIAPFFSSITNGLANVFQALNQASRDAEHAVRDPAWAVKNFTAQIADAQARFEKYGDEIKRIREEGGPFVGFKLAEPTREFALAGRQIERLTKELEKAKVAADQMAKDNSAAAAAEAIKKATPEQLAAIKTRNLQIEALQLSAREAELAFEASKVARIRDRDLKEVESKKLQDQQLLLLNDQKNLALEQQEMTMSAKAGFTAQQRADAALAVQDRFQAQYLMKQAEFAAALEQTNVTVGSSFELLAQGAGDALADLRKNAEKNFKAAGAAAVQGMGNAVGSAFNAFGAALAKGENATEAFKNAFLQSIGGLVTQLGQSYILQGIAASANPLMPGSGAGLIAAGIALTTFGGVLGGMGGGASTGPAAGSAGGEPLITEPTTPLEDTIEQTRREPDTQVQLIIQGDVLDSEQTGLRIAEILNQAYDKQGVVIKSGVMA